MARVRYIVDGVEEAVALRSHLRVESVRIVGSFGEFPASRFKRIGISYDVCFSSNTVKNYELRAVASVFLAG